MNSLEVMVGTYLSAWNEEDPALRSQLIEKVWTANGRLVDPPLAAHGRSEISEMASALHGQFPGHYFRRSSEIDEHHGRFRFAWDLVSPDGVVALAGLDVGQLDDSGQIHEISGFFGQLEPIKAGLG
jgi:hypothetical protein